MSDPRDVTTLGPNERFRLYELLWVKLSQEGDGIWSRFNILVGINLALFTGFAFFFAPDKRQLLWREFSVGVSLLGMAVSLWSLLVLHGLWVWHRHWKRLLLQLEEQFPASDGWVKPHTEFPRGLPFWRGAPGCTQLFFIIILLAWGVLFGVAVAHGS